MLVISPSIRNLLTSHKRTLLAAVFIFLYSFSITLAVPPTTKYQPGATLDPACAPGDTNCSVQILPDQTSNANKYLTTDGSSTAWSSSTLVLGGNFQTSGAYATTLTATGTTTLTLPTSGTLATTANINSAVSGTLNYIPKFTGTNTIGNSIIFDDGTNIGIGDATPSYKLEVNGNINAHDAITTQAGAGNITGGLSWSSTDTGQLYLNTVGTTTVNISAGASSYFNGGNVGVGTATPARIFTINGAANTSRALLQTTASGSTIADGAEFALDTSGNTDVWNYENGYMRFATNNTEALRIDSSGNVGIGTASPGTLNSVNYGSVGLQISKSTGGALAIEATLSGSPSIFFNEGSQSANSRVFQMLSTGGKFQLLPLADSGSGQATGLSMDRSGNVGIGTMAPGYLLDVQKDFGDTVGVALRISNNATVSSGTASTRLLFGNHTSASRDGGAIDVKSNTVGGDNMSMAFWVRDAANTLQERMRINATGTVSVGTTSSGYNAPRLFVYADPSTVNIPLEVSGDNGGRIGRFHTSDYNNSSTGSSFRINFGAGTGNTYTDLQAYTAGESATGDLILNGGGGNVGIGTTGPTSKLSFGSSLYDSGSKLALYEGTAGADLIGFGITSNSLEVYSVGATPAMVIKNTGNVGIGTTSPADSYTFTRALDIQGTGGAASYYRASGTNPSTEYLVVGYSPTQAYVWTQGAKPLTLGTNGAENIRIASGGAVSIVNLVSCGGVQTNGSGTLACTSDETLKNVQGEFTEGLDAIRDINPIAFSWKENSGLYDDDIIYYGFSAQNVQGSLPQAISHSYGGKLQVSQLTLMATAINAIKELDIKVESIPTLADQSLYSKIADFLRGIAEQSTAVVDNITAKFITADNVDSNKVQTNELCVKTSDGINICVTGDQLQALVGGSSGSTIPEEETIPVDPTCSDGIQNQDETGVDEGGVCAPSPTPEPPAPDPELDPVPEAPSGDAEPPAPDPEPTPTE